MTNKVLITGGTGFLGVHLARRFLKEKWEIVLFDLAPLDAKDLMGKVTVIQGDIRDKKVIEKAMKGVTHVVHAAAALPIQRTKKAIFSVNIDGTRQVLEASYKQKVKRLVFISTTAMYGVPKHLPERENSPIDPIGYYGQSKAAGEQLCQAYMEKGLSINIIRPKTFLGTERLGVFALWFEAIYLSRRLYLLGSGRNKYQLLAVTDVVDAIYKALTSPVENEIFNVGAKEFDSWRKDLGYVIRQDKSKAKITSLPTKLSQAILAVLEALNLSPIAAWHYKTMPVPSYVSIEKAERLLKWHPKQSNRELLLESYLWYKKHRKEILNRKGETHRVNWNFGILNWVSRF